MAFEATIRMYDSLGRYTSKRVTVNEATLADAVTGIGTFLTELNPLTDLGVESVSLTNKSTAGAFAPEDDSNVDVGATFRLRAVGGETVSFKIPGFPMSKVGPGGVIDPEDADVAAFFALMEAGGDIRISDGEVISSVISGTLDK